MRAALFLLALLAGCASTDDKAWPSLEPRSYELSPLVPRVPLGACAGCTSGPSAEAVSVPPPLLGLPQRAALPADAAAQLEAIEAIVADIEQRWPALRSEGLAAIAAAGEDQEGERMVRAGRFESLFLALGEPSATLDRLQGALLDHPEQTALASRAAALRQRLEQLEAVRSAGL
jgi:hypothetical protein